MVKSSYREYITNTAQINLDTEFTTLAAQVYFAPSPDGSVSPIDPETIARVQFFQTVRTPDSFEFKWIGAARCKDIYAREMKDDAFYKTEFHDESWICPDTRNITILNNPFLFDNGVNFLMVVNDCNVAETTDRENNLTTYSNKTCQDTTTVQENVDEMRVNFKIMGQNFNPKEYKENGKTTSVIRRRFTSDLMAAFSQSMKFTVVENAIELFDLWFVDLRDFRFFLEGYIETDVQFNLRTHDFNYIGTSFFAPKYQTNAIYGYYSIDWSQDEAYY